MCGFGVMYYEGEGELGFGGGRLIKQSVGVCRVFVQASEGVATSSRIL